MSQEEKLLRKLIKIFAEQNTKLRKSKGYGASHPVINRKPFMTGLGKSEHEYKQERQIQKKDKKPKTKVKVSKAFDREELEEYANILEGLINAEKLHKTVC